MFLMKHNVCYSTLFDILLLHLISFIVSFCYYLSNKEAYCHILPYPPFVEWRRNLSNPPIVSYCTFRQNSSRAQLPQKTYETFSKAPDTLSSKNLWGKILSSRQFKKSTYYRYSSLYSSSPILSSSIAVPKTLTNKAKTTLTIPTPP